MPEILEASLSERGFTLNRRLISQWLPAGRFDSLLPGQYRVQHPPKPAPYGYRNPVFYVYDACGIYLLDHQDDRLVRQVSFVFKHGKREPANPENLFSGRLSIMGTDLEAGMTEREVAARLGANVRRFLAGMLVGKIGGQALTINCSRREKNRSHSGARQLERVSIGIRQSAIQSGA